MKADTARTYLMERQTTEGITSREMARRLEMSEPNWCHVRNGRRRLAAVQILRACALYPDLRELVFSEPTEAAS